MTILYDLGGGFFDFTVIRDRDRKIDVISNELNISFDGENIYVAFCSCIIKRNAETNLEIRGIQDDSEKRLMFLSLCAREKDDLFKSNSVSLYLSSVCRSYSSKAVIRCSQLTYASMTPYLVL